MLSPSGRALFTMIMWIILVVAMIPLTALTISTLEELVIAVPGILATAGVFVTGFIWQWGAQDSSTVVEAEKRKRERLDTVLRGMSNEDLVALKRRLAEGDFDEGELVDEEGELLIGGRKR